MRDLRFAFRTLLRSRGFTSVVVLTLALGIGATTVVFDLFNVFYWRRPPMERAHEVVAVYTTHAQAFLGPHGALSWPDFSDYRAAAQTARLIGYRQTWASVDAGNGPKSSEIYEITGDFFAMLGIRPALGRGIEPGDDRAGAAPVAVISHALWQELGSSDDILGRPVSVGELRAQIIGVAPPRFRALVAGSDVALLVPAEMGLDTLGAREERTERSLHAWSVLARLPAGRSGADLQAELQVIADRLDEEHALGNVDRAITVAPAVLGHPADRLRIRSTLGVFATAVALLILIACANVANLLLARAIFRRREMGIRQSIGAGRARLVRQLLTESLLLAFAGAAGGLLLAFAARRLMVGFFGAEILSAMRFDYRVLGLTLLVSFVVTLLFGLAPAVITARVQLVSALKDAAPTGALRARLSGRSLLAVLQVALALVLLVCCGLLAGDLWRSRTADLGFDTEGLLVAGVELPETVEPTAGRAFFAQLRARAAAIPGVSSAGTALVVPPMILDVTTRLLLPEHPDDLRTSRVGVVDSEYFATMGISLSEGRLFEPRDEGSGHGVVVIDRLLAEQLWPGQPPLGKVLRLAQPRPGDPGSDYEVIGVVTSVTQFALARAHEPIAYFAWSQRYRPFLDLVLRTDGIDPETVFAALREELEQLDPTLALADPRTHDDLRWNAQVDRRLQTQTLGLFAIAGLLLALLGVFGVISYSVSRQGREIGIRIAVGASPVDVLRSVLARGASLAAAGVGLGLLASFWAVQLLRGTVPGLGPVGPALVAALTLFLFVAATASVWVPARRASRVDPLRALRQD